MVSAFMTLNGLNSWKRSELEKVQPPKVGLMREERARAAGEEGGDDGENRLGVEGCVTCTYPIALL